MDNIMYCQLIILMFRLILLVTFAFILSTLSLIVHTGTLQSSATRDSLLQKWPPDPLVMMLAA